MGKKSAALFILITLFVVEFGVNLFSDEFILLHKRASNWQKYRQCDDDTKMAELGIEKECHLYRWWAEFPYVVTVFLATVRKVGGMDSPYRFMNPVYYLYSFGYVHTFCEHGTFCRHNVDDIIKIVMNCTWIAVPALMIIYVAGKALSLYVAANKQPSKQETFTEC